MRPRHLLRCYCCKLHIHFCDEGIGPCLVYFGNAGAAIKDELTDREVRAGAAFRSGGQTGAIFNSLAGISTC